MAPIPPMSTEPTTPAIDLTPPSPPNEVTITGRQEPPAQFDRAAMAKQFALMKRAFRQWKIRNKKGAAKIVTRYTIKCRPVH